MDKQIPFSRVHLLITKMTWEPQNACAAHAVDGFMETFWVKISLEPQKDFFHSQTLFQFKKSYEWIRLCYGVDNLQAKTTTYF